MTMISDSHAASGPAMHLRRIIALFDRLPMSLATTVARFAIAGVFWQSGQTKVNGFALNDTAVYLFENEYRLPFVDPFLAAHMAAIAEHLFPILLVIGLASRFSALALLGMTLVIQLFVYPDAWPTHGTWAACLLTIIIAGPGPLSLDRLIAGRSRPHA